MAGKESIIENPVSHAAQKYGKLFVQDEDVDKWSEDGAYCTTGQFARLSGGFVKHCGPTAVTNVIVSFMNRAFSLGLADKKPEPKDIEEIFLQVAGIGTDKKIYWNTDFMKMFGGTFDHLTKSYLKNCLMCFGLVNVVPGRMRRATRKNFLSELDKGNIAYLQLRFDKPYGSHHVVCYGYSFVKAADSDERHLYLKIADGWSHTPRYMEESDMMLNSFIGIGEKKSP